jgi:hypothetical protein
MAGNTHDDLLSMYATYLDERGYQAVKIPETTTKTPDLEVSGHGNSYLNEFKSPDLLLDSVLGLYKFATTNSKLLQFVHTAIKQFRAHDPSHTKPWVITFASVNFQLNWHTLVEAMQGGIVVDGSVKADWTGMTVFKRWTADRYVADLYVWLQVSEEMKPYQVSFFTNDRSPHRPPVDGLVANLRSAPLSNADNNWLLV